ncbi:MAG: rRNA maturation RNase YbeY [Clostridiales bacterium]|nr:rRNA maturation RNase YbeY [Candidatus Crickella merdequi]
MLFIYDDEESRLDKSITADIEKVAQLAVASEFAIVCGEDADLGNAASVQEYMKEDIPAELSITVVSAEEIKSINNEYRGIDKVTDVLSFPQYETAEQLLDALEDDIFTPMLGDVVLCYDRACEQAQEYGTGIERELVYLTVHSIFHLLGYDHMEEDEKAAMRAREEAVMTAIGLAR